MRISAAFRSLALVAALAGSQAIVHAAEAAKQPTEQAAPTLDRKQLDEWLARPGRITVIDLRRPDEHQSNGTLPVYLSIQLAELEKYLDYIPRDRAVIPVSNHAGRARRAAAVLVKHGFNVPGVAGVQDYEAEGGQLSKIKPPAPRADDSAAAGGQRGGK